MQPIRATVHLGFGKVYGAIALRVSGQGFEGSEVLGFQGFGFFRLSLAGPRV